MKIKSPTLEIAVATVFANLINKASFQITKEESLVYQALIRANHDLENMSFTEVGGYLNGMSGEQLKGLANNVKGIYHELLFVQKENADGDKITAEVFEATNHPVSDVLLKKNGEFLSEVQLKATDSFSYVSEHISKYPNTPIYVTTEVASQSDSIIDSEFSNANLIESVKSELDSIQDQSFSGQMEDAATLSGILAAVNQGNKVLKGEASPKRATKETLKDVGIAVSSTALVDFLFS